MDKKPYFVQNCGLAKQEENLTDKLVEDNESVLVSRGFKETIDVGGVEAYTDWVNRYNELMGNYRMSAMYQALQETINKYSD